ncbi:MAG: hypothetical protein JKY15_07870 [Deltaproteobacteria bacterium]|nr:hypothetical protein [Deltaproteobacteria bacterium]
MVAAINMMKIIASGEEDVRKGQTIEQSKMFSELKVILKSIKKGMATPPSKMSKKLNW